MLYLLFLSCDATMSKARCDPPKTDQVYSSALCVKGEQSCLHLLLVHLSLAQKFLLVCLLCLVAMAINARQGYDGGMERGCHSQPLFLGAESGRMFPGWGRRVIYVSVLEHGGGGGSRDLLMETRYLSAEDFNCWLSSYPVVILLWVPELHKFIQALPHFRREWVFAFQKVCTGYLRCCHAYISFSLLPWQRSRRIAHISLIPFNIPALSCVGLDSRHNQFVNCSDRHMFNHGIDVWLIAEGYLHKEIFL